MKTPNAYIPPVHTRQPDGSIVTRPGKLVIVNNDTVTVKEAASILGMSQSWVLWQCQIDRFKTAHQPGGVGGRWKISRQEVLARLDTAQPRMPAQS